MRRVYVLVLTYAILRQILTSCFYNAGADLLQAGFSCGLGEEGSVPPGPRDIEVEMITALALISRVALDFQMPHSYS